MNENSSISSKPTWRRTYDSLRANPSLSNVIEVLFKINQRGSNLKTELLCGLFHFLSVASVLAVNPTQMQVGGYNKSEIASGTALSCAVTCILTGLFGNLPFVSTPTLATSIYLSAYMRNNRISTGSGNAVVFIVGILLTLCTQKQLSIILKAVMPRALQLGICMGLSILVALTALVRLGLVLPGKESILSFGDIWTLQVIIAMMSFIGIASCQYYGITGSYIIGLLFGSTIYWILTLSWPSSLIQSYQIHSELNLLSLVRPTLWVCIFDIFIIAIVLLAGLSSSLAFLAGIENDEGLAPRSRWLYFACGIGTIISSVMGSGPLIPSSESAIAISSGARTGLSAIVCGILFIVSAYLYPIWANIPISGTAPVFLMVGVLLFENAKRINWEDKNEVITVFITAIFASLTDSIFYGVIFGSLIHLILLAITGQLHRPLSEFYSSLINLVTPNRKEKSIYVPVSSLELTSYDRDENTRDQVDSTVFSDIALGATSMMDYLSDVQLDATENSEGKHKQYQTIN